MRPGWTLRLVIAALVAAVVPAPAGGQAVARAGELGLHVAASVGGDHDGLVEERIGVQGLLEVLPVLDLSASWARLFAFPEESAAGVTGSAWRATLTLRLRPLGPRSPVSVGGGVTYARFRRSDLPDGWSETLGVAAVAVRPPWRRVRPFLDLYGFFGGGSAALSAAVGINARLS
jgi:hypothetical protein